MKTIIRDLYNQIKENFKLSMNDLWFGFLKLLGTICQCILFPFKIAYKYIKQNKDNIYKFLTKYRVITILSLFVISLLLITLGINFIGFLVFLLLIFVGLFTNK